MRIHELSSLYLVGTERVVDVTDDSVDLAQLQVPSGVKVDRTALADVASQEIGPGAVLISAVGPTGPAFAEPEALATALRSLQPGGRAILLIGWPIEDLPYHRLLAPLVSSRCQVLHAVPLERAFIGTAVHCALIAECVDKPKPPASYLTDAGTPAAGEEGDSQSSLELQTVLRAMNEFVLSDLVMRPIRRRVAEQATTSDLRQQLAARDAQVVRLEARLARTEERLAAVESSASFQVGRFIVGGLRQPTALVTAPRNLVRLWRVRRQTRRQVSPFIAAPAVSEPVTDLTSEAQVPTQVRPAVAGSVGAPVEALEPVNGAQGA